jgi:hypothetical protein
MAHLNARGYWQKSVRVGDKVIGRHLGRGEIGAGLAECDRLLRERRERERLERHRADDEQRRRLGQERDRGRSIHRVVAVALEGLGFVRLKKMMRWRRSMAQDLAGRDDGGPPPAKAIRDVVDRARDGEAKALAELERLASRYPAAVARAASSDLTVAARRTLAKALAEDDPAARLVVECRLATMADDLAGAAPGPATRLAAAQAAFHTAEAWLIGTLNARSLVGTSPAQLRREHAALRRSLTALRAYAAIRKLESED